MRNIESLKYLLKDSVEPALLRQKKMLEAQGLNVKLEIVPGIPSEEINKYEKQNNISIIVVVTHGEIAAQLILFRIGDAISKFYFSPLYIALRYSPYFSAESLIVK